MLEFFDYSNRRGTLVGLLPNIHKLLTENANRDKLAGIQPPEHIVTWSQKMKTQLLDINRRFLVAMEGKILAGILFYRYEGTNLYIEDLHVTWAFRNKPHVAEGLLKRLEYDANAKNAAFYASERIKTDADKEILASVGFKETHKDGWESLGSMSTAIGILKLRYNR